MIEMSEGERTRVMSTLACLGIVATLFSMSMSGAVAESIPTSYVIEGVPLYQQIDAKGCGAASLQMVFEYYGPFIDQREVYNAARSGGTTLPDMARAAQFSYLSTAAGDRWPTVSISRTGYTNRDIGYAGFYYASDQPWLEQLKFILAQGYPVITLVNFLPGWDDPHYRVIVGYDDDKGVVLVEDCWSREFKDDMCYDGSSTQMCSENARDDDYCPFEQTYEDFLETWKCPTEPWGVPDLAYGAVFVTPWEVEISVPSGVSAGESFTVEATITYPCLAPFGDPTFPTFTASDIAATLETCDGLSIIGDPTVSPVSTLGAGQSVIVSWMVEVTDAAGDEAFVSVTCTGMVAGSLGPWHDYQAYDYEDLIGGTGSAGVLIVP